VRLATVRFIHPSLCMQGTSKFSGHVTDDLQTPLCSSPRANKSKRTKNKGSGTAELAKEPVEMAMDSEDSEQTESSNSVTLYVRGIPPSLQDEQALALAFSKIGPVARIALRTKGGGENAGWALVAMTNPEDAKSMLAKVRASFPPN
jgi:RNA recognition motif-containing protein